MGTSSLLVGIVFYSLALLHEGCAQADDTLVAGASGSDVVAAVIAKIEASGVFPTDNRLLRRIAYVESLDGMHPNTYRTGYYGGIWQVDMIGFEDTQNTASHPGLAAKHEAIERYFGSDFRWSNVKWEDLVKPLYSGIAARLFLSNKPEAIPPASDISGQAAYWKNFYNTDSGAGTEQSFIDAVNMLEQQEGMRNNAVYAVRIQGGILFACMRVCMCVVVVVVVVVLLFASRVFMSCKVKPN